MNGFQIGQEDPRRTTMNGFPPRDHLRIEIAEKHILPLLDAVFRGQSCQRREFVDEIDGRVDGVRQQRAAGEAEGKKNQNDRRCASQREDIAMREREES